MSTAGLVCIWFENNWDAHYAYEELRRRKIIQDKTNVTYLKEMAGEGRGWGFSDPEVGTMAKLAVGGNFNPESL